MDYDGTMQPQAHNKVFHLVTPEKLFDSILKYSYQENTFICMEH